jgi:hypothetical protein
MTIESVARRETHHAGDATIGASGAWEETVLATECDWAAAVLVPVFIDRQCAVI